MTTQMAITTRDRTESVLGRPSSSKVAGGVIVATVGVVVGIIEIMKEEVVKGARSSERHAITNAGATRKFAWAKVVCVALMTVTELYPVTLEHSCVDVL